ncbi:MAG: hypothetical protein ACRC6G_13725 [Deefgea sp.]
MTPERFNTALNASIKYDIDQPEFASYPIIGMGGNAARVEFYDNARQLSLIGVFAQSITQAAIDAALALYEAAPPHDQLDLLACVIIPYDAPFTFIEHDLVLFYAVSIKENGTLHFTDLNYDEALEAVLS